MLAAASFALAGPGAWSVDRAIAVERTGLCAPA